MDQFEWAERNLDAVSPHELQSRGVNVYFAPNVGTGRVVNLADGRLESFFAEEERPARGYFADLGSLAGYCIRHGIALSETNGQMSTAPQAGEAGDPLMHGEQRPAA